MSAQLRLSFEVPQNTDFEEASVGLREAFVSMENVLGRGFALWAGKRFYERQYLDIVDFFYSEMSGAGAGISGLDIGLGRLSFAVMRRVESEPRLVDLDGDGQPEALRSPSGPPGVTFIDARWTGLPAPVLGELALELVFAASPSGYYDLVRTSDGQPDRMAFDGVRAFGASIKHVITRDRLSQVFVVQYGHGFDDLFRLAGTVPLARDEPACLLRLVEDFMARTAGGLTINTTAIHERSCRSGGSVRTDLVARPALALTDHLSLVAELGTSILLQPPEPLRVLTKLTVGPFVTMQPLMTARPVLRLLLTYARWNQAFEGIVGGKTYRNATEGLTLAAQAEVSW